MKNNIYFIVIEYAIDNPLDMWILLVIQFANASIAFYEINKAGDAVAALKASLKPEATVKRDGAWKTVNAALIVPGDLVLLASGSAIPADGRVNHGQIDVDQSQLTGESLPVTCYTGDSVKMGSMVVRGEVEGTVQHTGADTFFGKTATMLQGDSEIGNSLLYSLQLALEEIDDKQLIVVPRDSGFNDKTKLNNAIKDLRSQGIKVIIGPIADLTLETALERALSTSPTKDCFIIFSKF